MVKVTLLGAGSGFTQPLFTDILNIEGIDRGIIGLVDIDGHRLAVNVKLMNHILGLMGKTKWKVEASTRREEVLKGTDYLISTIEVAGVECVGFDNDIPLKYGISQCIGDTIGPGGVMKALRTIPPFVEIFNDARRLCPDAIIMNYTNPMSMMTLAAARTTDQPFLGLCHSVQGTSRLLAALAGVPHEEMEWRCGGINHMAWYTTLKHKGRDLYPVLLEAMEEREVFEREPIRLEIMKHFGYFVTESSGHFSEYVPYFRKRKDLMKKFCRRNYLGGTRFYASNWPKWRKGADKTRKAMVAGKEKINLARGHEYAADIVEAHLLDRSKVIHASVANNGLIPNLPQTGVVEVPVLIDHSGVTPTYFGPLPEQVAALCRSNMCVFELVVQGCMDKDREAIILGMMVDPLSAAVCSPGEIRAMAEELFAAEKKYIPRWVGKKKTAGKVAFKRKTGKRAGGAAEVSSMAARNVG